jgi:4-hydroxy-tetrahydrodipicolinate reductase
VAAAVAEAGVMSHPGITGASGGTGASGVKDGTAAKPPLRVAVIGAAGRMGTRLVQAIDAAPDLTMAARVDLALGGSARALSTYAAGRIDVAVEFTRGDAPEGIGPEIEKLGCAWISGTTGLTAGSRAAMEAAAKKVAVLSSPNMSLGVALLRRMLASAARFLPEGWEMELIETHHAAKADAPSGTALALAELWNGVRGGEIIHGRSGAVGARPPRQVGIHAVRLPEGVGEHRILLGGPAEVLELTHRVSDRSAFVAGALLALRWLAGKPAGFYTLDQCVEESLR